MCAALAPLKYSIDLPLLTCSPRPMAAPAGGVISLISVMEGSKGLLGGKDGGMLKKKGRKRRRRREGGGGDVWLLQMMIKHKCVRFPACNQGV